MPARSRSAIRKPETRLFRDGGSIYGAKLLFQWRVVEKGKTKQRRLCEERVILIRAHSPEDALAQAQRYGARGEYVDPELSSRNRKVSFEFVGVMDLDDMVGSTCLTEYPLEVWYEFRERLQPMERKRKLLRPKNRMRAFHIPERRPGRIVL